MYRCVATALTKHLMEQVKRGPLAPMGSSPTQRGVQEEEEEEVDAAKQLQPPTFRVH